MKETKARVQEERRALIGRIFSPFEEMMSESDTRELLGGRGAEEDEVDLGEEGHQLDQLIALAQDHRALLLLAQRDGL
jgi:hypothetical protein